MIALSARANQVSATLVHGARRSYIRYSRIAKYAMPRLNNKQIALKPQDLVVALKLAIPERSGRSYAELAAALAMSASEVHGSVARLKQARLAAVVEDQIQIVRAALRDFVVFGARYSFPTVMGGTTRGMLTSYAAPPLAGLVTLPNEMPPVWPDSKGSVRGIAFQPLYPTVPVAARNDNALYELLVLFDALRGGAARERQIAQRMVSERLA